MCDHDVVADLAVWNNVRSLASGNSSSGLCSSSFSEAETHTLRVATLTGAGLSIAGTLFIIVSYVMLAPIRTFPYRLVMLLSVANLGSSVAYFVGLAGMNLSNAHVCSSTVGCYTASVMTQFFDVAAFLWIAVIAYNVFAVLVHNKGREVEGYEQKYHIFCWGVPAVLVVICAGTLSFGDGGIWCWIKKDRQTIRFFCYYLPLLMVFCYTAVKYLLISNTIQHQEHASVVTRRLRLYLVVFVWFRVWSVIHRSHNFFSDEPWYWAALMHAIFSPLQGFANALVYGCNAAVAREYRSFCRRHEPEGRIEDGMEDYDDDLDNQNNPREIRAQELTPV